LQDRFYDLIPNRFSHGLKRIRGTCAEHSLGHSELDPFPIPERPEECVLVQVIVGDPLVGAVAGSVDDFVSFYQLDPEPALSLGLAVRAER
jgi:hypothetical protein